MLLHFTYLNFGIFISCFPGPLVPQEFRGANLIGTGGPGTGACGGGRAGTLVGLGASPPCQ